MKKLLALVLSVLMMFSLVACSDDTSGKTDANDNSQVTENVETGLWSTAIYTEDTQVGEGANTVAITVAAAEKSIVITLKTDESNLGQALLESGLTEGTQGPYGLFISHVNGIKAVYEEDTAYWSFLDSEGSYMSTGVDSVELTGDDAYQLVYTLT